MRRRQFITLLGCAATAWPVVVRAQQTSAPLVGFVNMGARDAERVAAFRRGLAEIGYVDGQNVLVEYYWLENRFDRLPSEIGDLVRRRAAVIATPGSTAGAQAAKAASATVPIVFGVTDDPVSLGLVASLARPGGNATGINTLNVEVAAKRLARLHELLPKAIRVAVLVNPRTVGSEGTLREVVEAAGSLGLQLQVLNAGTGADIEAAFAALERERADALYLAPDAFFSSRRVQLATLAARHGIPTAHAQRNMVEAGGLMSYGPDLNDMFRQVGNYVGRILKGDKPTDLPVMQSTKFELVINLQTARALGIEVPATLIAIADEVIE